MSNLGMGFAPMGFSIFGFGTPSTSPGTSGNVLQGTVNGTSLDARYIDPLSRDYVIDASGRITGQSSNAQQVFLAVSTTLGSSAVPSLGGTLASIKTLDAKTIQSKVQNVIQLALSTLVRSGAISLNSVTTKIGPNGVSIFININWTDNSTGQNNKLQTVLNG